MNKLSDLPGKKEMLAQFLEKVSVTKKQIKINVAVGFFFRMPLLLCIYDLYLIVINL